MRMPRLFRVFGCLFTAAWPVMAGELYGNARFGFFAEIPPAFSVADPEPENGDGRAFHTADGTADLLLYGGWTLLDGFAAEVAMDRSSEAERGWTLTYESKVRGASASFSGVKGGRIFYARLIATCSGKAHAGYRLEYPAADKEQYDGAIQLLNRTLRAGEGSCDD